MSKRIGVCALLFLLCTTAAHAQTAARRNAGWITLFDGTSMAAWRGYRRPEMPRGWTIVDGALTRVGSAGDIITKDTFKNFELLLEWKVAPGANSGVFFNVVEDSSLETVYMSGPEYQILDNKGHHDGLDPKTTAGSNFALQAPVKDVTRPIGLWNRARIIVNKGHVEHWLNGIKVLEYQLWTDDWRRAVAGSKFKQWPEYGVSTSGHIALQDHGDWVAFRNIRIRKLD